MTLMFETPKDSFGRKLPPRTAGGQFREKTGKGGALYWYGDEVLANTVAATVVAVRSTSREAMEHAKANHPWRNQRGVTEQSGWVDEPIVDGFTVKARWGFASPALYLELGTYRSQSFPFMRPAQDATYPRLAGGIAASMI